MRISFSILTRRGLVALEQSATPQQKASCDRITLWGERGETAEMLTTQMAALLAVIKSKFPKEGDFKGETVCRVSPNPRAQGALMCWVTREAATSGSPDVVLAEFAALPDHA